MTSDRTLATCPGAAPASFWKPSLAATSQGGSLRTRTCARLSAEARQHAIASCALRTHSFFPPVEMTTLGVRGSAPTQHTMWLAHECAQPGRPARRRPPDFAQAGDLP